MPRALKIVGAVVAAALLLVAAGLFWAWRASQQVPEFYEQAVVAVPVEKQEAASDKMLQQATALANEVRREGHWEAVFTAEQINGWLAVDLRKNHAKLLPPQVSDPRVLIEPDGAKLACRWKTGQISTVFTLDVNVSLAEPNVVALRVHSARAGTLPMPLDQIMAGIRRAAADMDLAMRETQMDGDPVALITIPPPEGAEKTLIWIETIELREGAVYLAGRTVPQDKNYLSPGAINPWQAIVLQAMLKISAQR